MMRRTSTRRLLNITSTKKRDNQMPTVFTYNGGSPSAGGLAIPGNIPATLLFSPTTRDRDPLGNSTSESLRTNDRCYYRGFKERVMINTTTAASWRWRRIVFACKGITSRIPGLRGNYETNAGWPRALVNLSGDPAGTLRNGLEELLFEGQAGIDWLTTYTAKVDTKRVTLMYDKTRVINSGNQLGKFATYNMWHPINKNVVYDNDEQGEGKTNSAISTTSREGLGDVFVVDLFSCATGNAADALGFEPECTTYWHEK